ncbi:hypothetical protein EV279_2196 [Microbacterium sp. BK668]|nr:hypothetical protein EV279_2196 [Microbacterium sp. BK668]
MMMHMTAAGTAPVHATACGGFRATATGSFYAFIPTAG